jgi:transcriptional activator of cad operon
MPSADDPPPPATPVLCVGRWRVDPSADEITADGRTVKVEPLQMKLLLALAARPQQVVATQELLDTVWRDLVVTPNSVYQAVAQLRRQLGDAADEPAYIQTVHRKGYRMVAAVSTDDAPAPAEAPASAPAPAPAPPPAPAPRASRRQVLLAGSVVGAAAVGLGGVALWRLRSAAGAGPLRLAVLPFGEQSAGASDRALAHGLAHDVARALGRFAELSVVAPDVLIDRQVAVPQALGGSESAALAQRLGVAWLLGGELARVGSQLRLQVQLLAPPQSEPRWQQVFEQPAAAASRLPLAVAEQASAALSLPRSAAQPAPRGGGRAKPTSCMYSASMRGVRERRRATPRRAATFSAASRPTRSSRAIMSAWVGHGSARPAPPMASTCRARSRWPRRRSSARFGSTQRCPKR